MMAWQDEPMFRALTQLWTVLRELILALLGQPSRMGPNRAEAANNAAQRDNLAGDLQTPATAWEAAKAIGQEAGKAAILQPTEAARKRKK